MAKQDNTQEAKVRLKLDAKETQEHLAKLEAEAVDLRKKFEECFKKGDTEGIDETNKKLVKVNKEIDRIRSNAQNIAAAMKRVDEASPKELQQTLKRINTELNSGRVVRGSAEWKAYCEQAKEVKRALAEINDEMRDQEGTLDKIKDKFNDWGAAAAAGIAAFSGLVMSGKAAVETYAEMQAEEANVRKFTGMTEDQVNQLNEAFKKMDTRTSREDLNKLAQEAGRLGKQSVEDVLGFVVAANQINVALDDLGEGATLTLSKLTGIFGDEQRLGTEKSLLAVGSVINELSQNCSASAPYLADFSKRLAGVGAQAKMTIPQIMSFAAVLDSQGQNLEASATALSQLIMKLYQEPAKFAKAAGLDVKEFTDLLNKDANEAVLVLLDTLNKVGGLEKLAPMFEEMGTDGARSSAVMAALAGNIEQVRNQQKNANVAFEEAISVTNEYDVQNNTVQAGLDKARKHFTELAVSLGEKLVPVMKYAISGTSMMMRVISVLVDFIIKYKTALITTAAAVASYEIAVKRAVIWQQTLNIATAAATKLKLAWKVAVLLCSAAVNAMTGNVGRASAAIKVLSNVTKLNPMGLMVAGITAAVSALILFAQKMGTANQKIKDAADVSKIARAEASKEIGMLKTLYNATQDVTLSTERRIEAAKKLLAKYPETFKGLSTEAILAGKAAKQYDKLTASIIRNAETKAATEKIEKLVKQKMEMQEWIDDPSANWSFWDVLWTGMGHYTVKGMAEDASKQIERKKKEIEEIDSRINELISKFGLDETDAPEEKEENVSVSYAPSGETDKQRKEREKRERAAAKAQREADKKEREEFKKNLEEKKAIRDKAEAENIAAYSSGSITYRDFLERKNKIDQDYIDNRKKIYEDANKTESDDYAALLKEEEQLKARQLERTRKASLQEIEKEHKTESNDITLNYFDPGNKMFQNQKAYYQALLEEDIRYLEKKRDLYAVGSDEWESLNANIEDRIREDQLKKQEETAKLYIQYREQFEKLSFEDRKKSEIQMLDELLEAKLISEEEYNKAMKKLRKEDMDDQISNLRKVKSEYADMAVNVYDSFTALFESIKNGGEDMWTDISKAAEASFAVMSAFISQFSALSSAQRDIELAKLDKYYDAEIDKAGSNTKKKEQLEKEKEAATAKIKKKYNDRAMKIEIAQAIAQTAQAAIAAYASAAAIPVTGWIMAPIAAALATAAGAVQIAVIKKQHEAEAAGYYEGGFTGGKNYRRIAGVVHEGEFVAAHDAVNNPQLSPIWSILDIAQRNNTVGSLTAEDVSIALAQGRGVSARGEAMAGAVAPTIVTNAIDTEPIANLNSILQNGIEAVVILDGEQGLHQKYTHYLKLLDNPKR